MREGAYGADTKSGWREEGAQFPRIPGSDITGVVIKIGENVEASMMGKDIVVFPFPYFFTTRCTKKKVAIAGTI